MSFSGSLATDAATGYPAAMAGVRIALTGVPTEELKQLLRLVHRGDITTPISAPALAFAGLQHRTAEIMQSLRGLDEAGARAVLVAVLAERGNP